MRALAGAAALLQNRAGAKASSEFRVQVTTLSMLKLPACGILQLTILSLSPVCGQTGTWSVLAIWRASDDRLIDPGASTHALADGAFWDFGAQVTTVAAVVVCRPLSRCCMERPRNLTAPFVNILVRSDSTQRFFSSLRFGS